MSIIASTRAGRGRDTNHIEAGCPRAGRLDALVVRFRGAGAWPAVTDIRWMIEEPARRPVRPGAVEPASGERIIRAVAAAATR